MAPHLSANSLKFCWGEANTHPDSSWPATWVPYNAIPLNLLQVGVPVWVLWEYFDATVTGATVHPEAAEYSHSTLNRTATWSSHSGTAYTHVTGRRNLDVYCENPLSDQK